MRTTAGGADGEAVIAAAYEARYERHPAAGRDTTALLAEAFAGALEEAGLTAADVDGLGVASFSLQPDHAIDLCWRLGITVRWLMEDPHGGASAVNLLQHAVRAVEAGDAETIVLLAGDHLDRAAFARLVRQYNRATAEQLVPLGYPGPNALFAMLTTRYGEAHGLDREDLGCVPVAQRAWAGRNPGAVYRAPLSFEEYLAAPPVATPLTRYDCVPVVAGADAIVVTRRERAAGPTVRVRAIAQLHNDDQQQDDRLRSGFATLAPDLWRTAGVGPEDVDAAYVYDDYPVMAVVQAADLGLVPGGDLRRWLRRTLVEEAWPLNTSGGQLSAGQAGAAAGLHGVVEAVQQLRGRAGERQVPACELAVVTGYGMVLYRHGACHGAAVLERLS
ncbi:thiolase family protein [Patulibacter medicamentivorans]|uniref:thiolase family protein n=1 Tax=Patulibacter medicamentivorans TaxID=1097667 RepID=UPI00058BAA91|nr:thiolase family protein [Patulibacter medicamentivorans]